MVTTASATTGRGPAVGSPCQGSGPDKVRQRKPSSAHADSDTIPHVSLSGLPTPTLLIGCSPQMPTPPPTQGCLFLLGQLRITLNGEVLRISTTFLSPKRQPFPAAFHSCISVPCPSHSWRIFIWLVLPYTAQIRVWPVERQKLEIHRGTFSNKQEWGEDRQLFSFCHGTRAKSCLTLCDPMDCNLLGSSVHGISQARTLEWLDISFSRGSSQPRDQTHVSWIAGRFFTTEPPGKPRQGTQVASKHDRRPPWLPGQPSIPSPQTLPIWHGLVVRVPPGGHFRTERTLSRD